MNVCFDRSLVSRVGSEAVYGAECYQSKPVCSSCICHSVLWESVSSLQSLHQPAALPHLDHAAGHHDSHSGPLRERKGTHWQNLYSKCRWEYFTTVKIYISSSFSCRRFHQETLPSLVSTESLNAEETWLRFTCTVALSHFNQCKDMITLDWLMLFFRPVSSIWRDTQHFRSSTAWSRL